MTTIGLAIVLMAEPDVALPPCEEDRRWVLIEAPLDGSGAFLARDKGDGTVLPAQSDGTVVRWLVPHIPRGIRKTYAVERGTAEKGESLSIQEGPGGILSIRSPRRGEITCFRPAPQGLSHLKPCFYPLVAHGVNVLRGFPLEEKPGEVKDHPHHTGIYHAFGEVNGREYWSKLPIENKKVLRREAGPVYARLGAENHWGQDLVEVQDVFVLNVGDDALMDWTITLTAAQGPVVFARNVKMAKEGSFAIRVAQGLVDPDKKRQGQEIMSDALGNRGEAAIRAAQAPWVDYSGTVEGKKVGVAIMNHPSSFRFPTNWHVRAYGLFAANPWLVRGEHHLEKGNSIVFRYRVYVHAGDAAAGRVAEVYAGFTQAKRE